MTERQECYWCPERATTYVVLPIPAPVPRVVPHIDALPPKPTLRTEDFPACDRHFRKLGGDRRSKKEERG